MAKRFIVGESGGPTPVIDWEVAGALAAAQASGWEVYGMINGLEGLLNANIPGNIVDLSHMDPMEFVFSGPGAALDTTRIKPKDDQYKKMAEHLKLLGINAVVYFGGNDSADQLLGLGKHAADVQLVHGIKTVDNDLPKTHHSPGFGSAALFNATALKNVHSDYSSYRTRANFKAGDKVVQAWDTAPAIIYQVMGRKAGWLAQATGFAKVDPAGIIEADRAPHVILSREIPFAKDKFLAKCDQVLTKLGEVVIIVQEDLTDAATGKSIEEVYAAEVARDEHGNIQHGRSTSFSTATFLAQLVTSELKVKSVLGKVKEVALVPQHIQRSGMMSAVDASEAYLVGGNCVKALNDKLTKKSVILKRERNRTVAGITDLENIAAKDRSVPLEWINGLDGPTQDFVDEFIYLVGGPAALPYYSKLPFGQVSIPPAITNNPYIKPEKKK